MDGFGDDWFYESIRCYKKLQMYDLQIEPNLVTQINDTCLCLAGTRTALKRTEVMCIKLPKKLLLPPEEEGRCKGNDFSIVSGGFYDAPIHQMSVISEKERILASFDNEIGLSILSLGTKTSNVIVTETKLLENSSIKSPNFAINGDGNKVVASKTVQDPLIALDVTTGQITTTVNIPELLSKVPGDILSSYTPQPIVMNTSTGCTVSLDERTFNALVHIAKGGIKSQYTLNTNNDNQVSILSVLGQCEIIDTRFPIKPLASGNLNFPPIPYAKPKVVLSSNNRISFSGFGSCVYVFETQGNEFRHVFTHRGHSQSETNSSDGLVTDHLWLPLVSENFLVSCCDNGTLNCWEYKV